MEVICINEFILYKLPSDIIDININREKYEKSVPTDRKVLCELGDKYKISVLKDVVQLFKEGLVLYCSKSDIINFMTLAELREENIKRILNG